MIVEPEALEVWSQWAEKLDGPLSAEAAAARAGVERAAHQAATDAGEVITLEAEGRLVYPGCQFRHGWPAGSLITAWQLVAAATVSPWTACSWLVSPDDALDGRSPVDYAPDGSASRLLSVARYDAARLRR